MVKSRQICDWLEMSANFKIDVIIVAAGRGERVGSPENGPKQYRMAGKQAIIAHTIDRFLGAQTIRRILVVHHEDDLALLNSALGARCDLISTTLGGSTRQASVLNGLNALSGAESPDYVMIHDAVRPFITEDTIQKLSEHLGPTHGLVLAHQIADSLMRGDAHHQLLESVDRDGLWAAQTPQCFPFEFILDAHQKAAEAGHSFTDDASLARHMGLAVQIIGNESDNIKITWPGDLKKAEDRLRGHTMKIPDMRAGNGYDVHATMPGNAVTLCGVAIPADIALRGHSDADVGMHALTDALLSTIGAGDIGTHFPPSDPQWKGAASHIFLRHAAELVHREKGTITHCAITLICERPKIGPHRDAMIAALSEALGIAPERVSVTATTNEMIGFVGRGEGIAAIATASVVFPPIEVDDI